MICGVRIPPPPPTATPPPPPGRPGMTPPGIRIPGVPRSGSGMLTPGPPSAPPPPGAVMTGPLFPDPVPGRHRQLGDRATDGARGCDGGCRGAGPLRELTAAAVEQVERVGRCAEAIEYAGGGFCARLRQDERAGLHQRGRSEHPLDGEREVPRRVGLPARRRAVPPDVMAQVAVRELNATTRSPHDSLDHCGREHRTGREERTGGGGRLTQAVPRRRGRLDGRPGVSSRLEPRVRRVRTAQPFSPQQARHRDRRRRPVVHPRGRSGLPLAAPDDQFVDGNRCRGSLMVSCGTAARFHSRPLRSVELDLAEFLGVGSLSYPRSSPPC